MKAQNVNRDRYDRLMWYAGVDSRVYRKHQKMIGIFFVCRHAQAIHGTRNVRYRDAAWNRSFFRRHG